MRTGTGADDDDDDDDHHHDVRQVSTDVGRSEGKERGGSLNVLARASFEISRTGCQRGQAAYIVHRSARDQEQEARKDGWFTSESVKFQPNECLGWTSPACSSY